MAIPAATLLALLLVRNWAGIVSVIGGALQLFALMVYKNGAQSFAAANYCTITFTIGYQLDVFASICLVVAGFAALFLTLQRLNENKT